MGEFLPPAEGQTFVNPALVGSGTINEDGTYGPPLQDPTVANGVYVETGPRTHRAGRPTPAEDETPKSQAKVTPKK